MDLQVADTIISSLEGDVVTEVVEVEDPESLKGSQVIHAYPFNIAATINLNESVSSGISLAIRQSRSSRDIARPFKPPAFVQDEYATIADFGIYIYNNTSEVSAICKTSPF